MSIWTKGIDVTNTSESAYNESIGGNSLPEGFHKGVTISSVEATEFNNKPVLQIVWEKEGMTKRQTVWVLDYEKADQLSKSYTNLASCVVGDYELKTAVFTNSIKLGKPEVLSCIVGTKANIIVKYPKKGSTIRVNEQKEFIIADLETGEVEPGTATYLTLQDAKEFAKENNMKLKYLDVGVVLKNGDEIENNERIIKESLQVSGAGGGAGTAGAGTNSVATAAF